MIIDRAKLDLLQARAQMTGQQLTMKANISWSTLVLAKDEKDLRPQTAGRIAAALGVDVTEILKEG